MHNIDREKILVVFNFAIFADAHTNVLKFEMSFIVISSARLM